MSRVRTGREGKARRRSLLEANHPFREVGDTYSECATDQISSLKCTEILRAHEIVLESCDFHNSQAGSTFIVASSLIFDSRP